MTRGVLLFAFNNGHTDYFEMAVRTTKRINRFLGLPVTVVTDSNTIVENYENVFDSVIFDVADTTNFKDTVVWINKGRHRAYELTPYDETLVLDTDYLINSNALLRPFDMMGDFMCHKTTDFIFIPDAIQETISSKFINTCWATVLYFKKTDRVKHIFQCMEMIQNNYQHYINVFDMVSLTYRNDYALTIALWIVNGHCEDASDYIPWPLLHLNHQIRAHRINDTEYIFFNEKHKYITMKDVDFHLLSKKNFMELTNE